MAVAQEPMEAALGIPGCRLHHGPANGLLQIRPCSPWGSTGLFSTEVQSPCLVPTVREGLLGQAGRVFNGELLCGEVGFSGNRMV